MPQLSPTTILCDMDGMLLDSERLSMQALVEAGAELGADLPLAFCHSMIGCPMDRIAHMLTEREGPDFAVDALVLRHEAILAGFVDDGHLKTRPGVEVLLDTIERLGLKRAVVTSSARGRTTHHLDKVDLLRRFPLLITRDEVTRGKPDPEPYRLAAERLGSLPAECLALEDSYNGVRAAHAAGIRVIMIPDLLPATDEMHEKAFMIAPDLHAVAAMLKDCL